MKRKNDKISIILRVLAISLCIVFISLKSLTTSLAKYTSSVSSSDFAKVAKFISIDSDITSSGTIDFDSSVHIEPKQSKSVELIINNDGETTVEVTLSYSSNGNLPLDIYWDGFGGDTYIVILKPGETHSITLYVEWQNTLLNFIYHNTVDTVVINTTCEQVN